LAVGGVLTHLAGDFETNLGLPDAREACADAFYGLGWHVESVETSRIVSYADPELGDQGPVIEILLNETAQGTDLRIIGSESDARPLPEGALIGALDEALEAIQTSVEGVEETMPTEVQQRVPPPPPPPDVSEAAAAQGAESRSSRARWLAVAFGVLAVILGAGVAFGAAGGGTTQTTTVHRTTTETRLGRVETVVTTQTQTEIVTETATSASASSSSTCDPNYSGGCVPVYPPDVDCSDLSGPVTVVGSDPHGLDADGDGSACEF
jgi:hypothetical protein